MSLENAGGRRPVERLELPMASSAARIGREFVTSFCAGNGLSDSISADAVLITSELVTNAYLHTRTATVLGVGLHAGVLRIEVTDRSDMAPILGTPNIGRAGRPRTTAP